eukprot:scaffold35062_cov60-Phaeocystis_antarctica.AAC.2
MRYATQGSNPGSTGSRLTGSALSNAGPERAATHAFGPCPGQRDRATGRLVLGHASALAPALPPDATCLACGGIQRIDQVRALRRAGYDGVVLGRVLAGPDGDALLAQIAADSEVAPDTAHT